MTATMTAPPLEQSQPEDALSGVTPAQWHSICRARGIGHLARDIWAKLTPEDRRDLRSKGAERLAVFIAARHDPTLPGSRATVDALLQQRRDNEARFAHFNDLVGRGYSRQDLDDLARWIDGDPEIGLAFIWEWMDLSLSGTDAYYVARTCPRLWHAPTSEVWPEAAYRP